MKYKLPLSFRVIGHFKVKAVFKKPDHTFAQTDLIIAGWKLIDDGLATAIRVETRQFRVFIGMVLSVSEKYIYHDHGSLNRSATMVNDFDFK